jgi:uncharacterized RDD family membrane protein YckC
VSSAAPAIAATVPARPAPDDRSDARYAGLVTRAIAFAIDSAVIDGVALLVFAIVALASTVLHIGGDLKTVLLAVGGAAFVVWSAGYFIAFWGTDGRTLGNRVMYLRVVRADGGRLGHWRAARRFVGLVLAVVPFGLGLLGILLNERRRGFQDRLANTVVVHDPERREPRPGSADRAR